MALERSTRRGKIELAAGLLALAGILAAGAALASRRNTPVDPGLIVDPTELDFGTAWEQPALRHTFSVTNPTNRSIQVAEIKTGCGCTTVEPRAFILPAGGRQQVTATLNLEEKAIGGTTVPFRVELLPVLAHQPPGHQTAWPLAGYVRPNPIVVSNETIDFGNDVIFGETVPTRALNVSLLEGALLCELRASVEGNQGAARIQKISSGQWELEVTPAEGLPRGPFAFKVRLEATLSKADQFPSRSVSVIGIVRDDVVAWPSAVRFGTVTTGETATEYVTLASHAGRSFEVTEIDAPDELVIAPAAEQIGDGSQTFVLKQKISTVGAQTSQITFRVVPSGSQADNSNVHTITVVITYHGMAEEPRQRER